MSPADMVKHIMGCFKQNWRRFCENQGLAEGRELSPGDCRAVFSLLKQALGEVGADTVRTYVEGCDTPANTIDLEGAPATFKAVVDKEFHVGFGVTPISRRVFWREDGGGSFAPLDAMFNVAGEYFFPDIREAILFAVGSTPVADVVENMGKFCLAPPKATAVRRLVGEAGGHMEEARPALEAAGSLAARLPAEPARALVVSMDAATMPVRKPDGKGRDYEVEFKMAMCGTVGVYGEATPDEDGVLRMERIGATCFARMPEERYPSFRATLDSEVARMLAALPGDIPRQLLMDGAAHQWAHVQGNPLYRGFLPLLDFYHASEHLGAAAEALFGPGAAAGREWEERWEGKLLEVENQALGVCRSIEYHLKTKHLSKTARADAESQATFFRNNHGRMNYAWFRDKGLPIGSGPVEACCKSLVKTRMCGSGMSWTPEGGQAVLTLRAYRKSGGWDQMWDAYLKTRMDATPAWRAAA